MAHDALAVYLRRRGWPSPYPGIFVEPASPNTFEQAAYIATLIAGRHRVLVARRAAAYLWGMVTTMPDIIELVVPADRHDAEVDGVELTVEGCASEVSIKVRRTRTLKRSHARDLKGVPLTSPARTVLDLAEDLSLGRLRVLVIDAIQRRVLALDELALLHDAVPSYRGRKKVTTVLADLATEMCDSRLEYTFRKEARRRGFKPFPRPFPFRCSDGRTISIDVAFPAEWVAVELDGLAFHSNRESLVRDHRRQNRAVAGGWRVLRVDWSRLSQDADALFDELAALLGSPHPHPGPAPLAN